MNSLKESFLNPSDEFTPIPFWFWNDKLTHSEIKRQIQDFYDKGVAGFVLHPRMGIPKEIEYLSDDFMKFVLTAVQKAHELNMIVFLYDEAMYPSGSANGQVVKGHPEFASKGIKVVEKRWNNEKVTSIKLDKGEKIVSVQAVEKVNDDQINKDSITILEAEEDLVCFTPPTQGNWSILFFIETFTGGTIRGIHFGQDDGESQAPASADLLNREAVQRFIDLTHERYYSVLSTYFGTTIKAFFTDEPDIVGRGAGKGILPWSQGFLDDFQKEGNQEQALAALWFNIGSQTEEIRQKYRTAVNQRLSDTYYKALSDWCQCHGIALTGHPAKSDDIGLLDHFQIPGQDVVWRWVAPEEKKGIEGEHSTAGKCSSDAARHRGKRKNLNEVLGVCGIENSWYLTGGDMKWYLDWLFVRGVNLISPHAFYYSINGKARSHERPPDVGPHNIWWPYYKMFSTYIKRLSWLMTDSINQTTVAVICEEDFLPWQVVQPLYEQQIEFNYLEESLLKDSLIMNGAVNIQQQQYRVLLVEEMTRLKKSTISFLQNFQQAGGHVISYQQKSKGLPLISKNIIFSLKDVISEIDSIVERKEWLEPLCSDIRISHIQKEKQSFYLITNEGEKKYEGSIFLTKFGFVEKWNAWSGEIVEQPVEIQERYLRIPVQLERRESIIFRSDPSRPPNYSLEEKWEKRQMMPLNQEWLIRENDTMLQHSMLSSWSEWENKDFFSGTITYEQLFTMYDMEMDQVILDLGEVHELAHVWINGRDAGVRMWAPYRFNISPYLRRGSNQIKVKVTNSKANELDQVKLPSGLIGPVMIESFRKRQIDLEVHNEHQAVE